MTGLSRVKAVGLPMRSPNNAFERSVMRHCRRAASALVHCAPAARIKHRRAAAQRER